MELCIAWVLVWVLTIFASVLIWHITRPLEDKVPEEKVDEVEGSAAGVVVDFGLEVVFWTLLGL